MESHNSNAVLAAIEAGISPALYADLKPRRERWRDFEHCQDRATWADYEALLHAGVPPQFLVTEQGKRVGMVLGSFDGDYWYPDESGARLSVLPVEDCDLVAFELGRPADFRLRHGVGCFLGEDRLEGCHLLKEDMLMVFETPLSWMRGGGSGVCTVNQSVHLPLHFDGITFLVVETPSFGRKLERALQNQRRVPEVRLALKGRQ